MGGRCLAYLQQARQVHWEQFVVRCVATRTLGYVDVWRQSDSNCRSFSRWPSWAATAHQDPGIYIQHVTHVGPLTWRHSMLRTQSETHRWGSGADCQRFIRNLQVCSVVSKDDREAAMDFHWLRLMRHRATTDSQRGFSKLRCFHPIIATFYFFFFRNSRSWKHCYWKRTTVTVRGSWRNKLLMWTDWDTAGRFSRQRSKKKKKNPKWIATHRQNCLVLIKRFIICELTPGLRSSLTLRLAPC